MYNRDVRREGGTTVLNTTLSIAEARERLTRLPEELHEMVRESKGQPVVKVTRRNKPVLAILPWVLYESILETLEVLNDEEQMVALRQALQQVGQGEVITWSEAKEQLGWNDSDVPSVAADRTTAES